MKKLIYIFSIVAGFGAAAQVESAPQAPANIASQLQSILDNARTSFGSTGALMGVYAPGEWVWYGGSGSAKRGTQIDPDETFRYRIASISKSFAAVSILQLQENGILDVDDNISSWLRPTLLDTIPNSADITIRQLLNHYSGLKTNTAQGCLPTTEADLLQEWTFEESVVCGTSQGTWGPAGSSWNYSNLNYTLLLRIVENASGMDFDSYIQQNIMTPAGLTSTQTPDSAELVGDHMGCYWDAYPAFSDFSIVHPSAYVGYAGLTSKMEDLFKYYEAINGLELFNQTQWDEMFNTMVPTGFSGYEYGLGVDHEIYANFDVYGHHGEVGNSNYWYYYPALDVYLVYNFTDHGFFPTSYNLVENPVYQLLAPVLGQDELTRNKINVYPNPAQDFVTIDSDLVEWVSILDLNGREVLHSNGNRVDVSSLANGMYLLRANLNGEVAEQKLIVD